MQTEIYAKHTDTPPRFHAKAEARIRRSLRRWRGRLAKVRVYVNEHGPRGGDDTSCLLVIDTDREGAIVATGQGTDPNRALRESLDRARKRLRRSKDKRGQRRRRAMRRFEEWDGYHGYEGEAA